MRPGASVRVVALPLPQPRVPLILRGNLSAGGGGYERALGYVADVLEATARDYVPEDERPVMSS